MYQKQYNEKKIKMRAAILVYNQYPDWPVEKKEEEALTDFWLDTARKSLVVGDFAKKIQEQNVNAMTYLQCESVAFDIINNMPEELWPNVEEWIDDQPISDIKVHDVSVPDVMFQFPEYKIPFLSVMKCMCMWKEYDYKGENFCNLYFT